MIKLLVVFAVVSSLTGEKIVHRAKRFIEYGPDIAGPFCATRRGGCCPGRIDDCSVPILDTLCYCDRFCNRTRSDCCPDYFSFCFGQERSTPPPLRVACEYRGRPYPPNAKVKINCQQCTCAPDSGSNTGFSFRCSGETCLIRQNIIDAVNDGPYGWQASNYSMFWGMTLEDGMRYRLGTFKPDAEVERMNPIKNQFTNRLPDSFDARVKWPGWVSGVRDQGNCAASWAFSTTALSADRLSIESRGAFKDTLSPQHLLSCNVRGQNGCTGGSLDRAWWFLRKRGVTTEQCYPYSSGLNDQKGRCLLTRTDTSGTCPSRIPFRYESIYQATPPYRLKADEYDIMAEIYNNGPVQATFKVKEDFFMYSSGVYRYSKVVPDSLARDDERRQYHSVRIIGWGVDRQSGRDIKYWLCANSWGENWGENGFFKILRGVNECDIEAFVLGVWGKVEADVELRELLTRYRQERQRESFGARFGEFRRRVSHMRRRSRRHHLTK